MVCVDVKHHAYLLTYLLTYILYVDIPLVEFMYLVLRVYPWWSLYTLYLLACQVRVIVGDSGLCCVRVTFVQP